jgi:hypothetical protein
MRSRRQHDDRTFAGPAGSAGRPLPSADLCCRLRHTARRLLLAAALLITSGCQLNRSFFQMDSNSRVPFFGVDLAPSLPRRSSSVDGVSRLQSATAHRSQPLVEPEQTSPPPQSLALPLSESVVTSTASEGAPVETFR